jgi:hypothetical protein
VEYLVTWKGYGNEDRQFVPSSEFDKDDAVVLEFCSRYPGKPHHGG